MKATILYRTDHHHSYASREIVGVYTKRRELMRAVTKLVKGDQGDNPAEFDTKEELKCHIQWCIEFFAEKGQTQGLCYNELASEQIELNKIIF